MVAITITTGSPEPPPDNVLREVRPSDLDALVALDEQVQQWDCLPRYLMENFFDDDPRPGVLIEQNGSVVGFLLLFRNKRTTTLHRLSVAPDLDQHALMCRLLNAAKKATAKRGPRHLVVDVHERELTKQLALSACGFHCLQILSEAAENSEDLYHFTWYPELESDLSIVHNRCTGLY